MSLPRYCINMDELSDLIAGVINGLNPSQFIYEEGWQRSKGFRAKSDSNGDIVEQIEIPYEEYLITGLRVGMTSMNNSFDKTNKRDLDYFHLIVNDDIIFDSVYMKDVTMYKNFRVPLKVTQEMIDEGLDIKFVYHNNEIEMCGYDPTASCESNISVDIWFDIDFLAEPKLTEVTINYLDDSGNNIAPSITRYISEGEVRIFSEEINGFYVVGSYYEDIDVVYNTPIVVDFVYTTLSQ